MASVLHRVLVAAAVVGGIAIVTAAVWQEIARAQADENARRAVAITGGDPARGRELIGADGCGGCHVVPGVPHAHGLVGPPLSGFAGRLYVGGVVANSPANLVRWIVDPRAIDPLTAMPSVGLDEDSARDVAAYLYTLR